MFIFSVRILPKCLPTQTNGREHKELRKCDNTKGQKKMCLALRNKGRIYNTAKLTCVTVGNISWISSQYVPYSSIHSVSYNRSLSIWSTTSALAGDILPSRLIPHACFQLTSFEYRYALVSYVKRSPLRISPVLAVTSWNYLYTLLYLIELDRVSDCWMGHESDIYSWRKQKRWQRF